MKTRITELFEIEYPIILPGMIWISVPELVATVCNAGNRSSTTNGAIKRKSNNYKEFSIL